MNADNLCGLSSNRPNQINDQRDLTAEPWWSARAWHQIYPHHPSGFQQNSAGCYKSLPTPRYQRGLSPVPGMGPASTLWGRCEGESRSIIAYVRTVWGHIRAICIPICQRPRSCREFLLWWRYEIRTHDGQNFTRPVRKNVAVFVAHQSQEKSLPRRKKMDCLANMIGGAILAQKAMTST